MGNTGMSMTASTSPALSWKHDMMLAAVLATAGAVATLAVLPYLLQTFPDLRHRSPVPLHLLVTIQVLQAFVLLAMLALTGLRLGRRVGLDAPLLRCWLGGRMAAPPARTGHTVCLGIITGVGLLALISLIDPLIPAIAAPSMPASAASAAVNGLLASLYGGIVEELLLRLFLMTLLAWLLSKLCRQPPTATMYWLAIVIAALIFAAGHLPAAAALWGLDALIIMRTMLLNALPGIVFGWLYWRRGLEMAMLAHFAADVVLHAIAPLFSAAHG